MEENIPKFEEVLERFMREAVKRKNEVPKALRDREMCLEPNEVPKELLDREVCLKAVKNNGRALRLVPEELLDREVHGGLLDGDLCLEDITKRPSALDKECLEAITKRPSALDKCIAFVGAKFLHNEGENTPKM